MGNFEKITRRKGKTNKRAKDFRNDRKMARNMKRKGGL